MATAKARSSSSHENPPSSLSVPASLPSEGPVLAPEVAHRTEEISAADIPFVPATIQVPEDVETIGGAMEMARDGDRILVAPGEYYESVVFNKAVSLEGRQVRAREHRCADAAMRAPCADKHAAIFLASSFLLPPSSLLSRPLGRRWWCIPPTPLQSPTLLKVCSPPCRQLRNQKSAEPQSRGREGGSREGVVLQPCAYKHSGEQERCTPRVYCYGSAM
eukprot:419266-Rhodomonas_salina.1